MRVPLEHKSVAVSLISAAVDDPVGDDSLPGVSITGIEDNVGDIIMPGAFSRTIALRKPKGGVAPGRGGVDGEASSQAGVSVAVAQVRQDQQRLLGRL